MQGSLPWWRRMPRPWLLAGTLAMTSAIALAMLAGCDQVESWLNQASGRPEHSSATGQVLQAGAPVPAGPHLYCITNIGRTLVAYSLAARQTLTDTQRVLYSDPVGPWFSGGDGYYISRVAGDGSGKNALIRFDPVTLDETGRLNFPPNSNPVTMLVDPAGRLAYVALSGSTFDDFATDGLSVVALATLSQVAFLDLNDPGVYPAGATGTPWTSLNVLVWDAACTIPGSEGSCVYAVANNWNGALRPGRLLALALDAAGVPSIADAVALGDSPAGTLLFDGVPGARSLWVVNNGGYVEFGGHVGSLQQLDPERFADGVPGNETRVLLDQTNTPDMPADPTGIYRFNATQAWVTTYPDDTLRTLDLPAAKLAVASSALPRVTGPLFTASAPAAALFAGMGGYGHALLGELDSASGALLATYDLGAGNGTVSCAQYTVP